MPLAFEKVTKLIHADRHWRAGRLLLGPEWDNVTEMQVIGNASAPTPHSKLPKPVLEWLAANNRRSVLFLRRKSETVEIDGAPGPQRKVANIMNIDLPARCSVEGGYTIIHRDHAAVKAQEHAAEQLSIQEQIDKLELVLDSPATSLLDDDVVQVLRDKKLELELRII